MAVVGVAPHGAVAGGSRGRVALVARIYEPHQNYPSKITYPFDSTLSSAYSYLRYDKPTLSPPWRLPRTSD